MECPERSILFFRLLAFFPYIVRIFLFPTLSHATSVDTSRLTELVRPVMKPYDARQWEDARVEAEKLLILLSSEPPGIYPAYYEPVILGLLADCLLEMGQYDQALSHYEMALTQLDNSADGNVTHLAGILNKLGNYYLEVKDFSKAEPLLERALTLRLNHYGPDHLLVADVYNNLGISRLYSGDFAAALEYHRGALRIRLLHLSSPHEQLAQSYNNLAQCYQDAGEQDKAIEAYQRALANYPDSRIFDAVRADALLNLGVAYLDLSEPDRSMEYFHQALQLYRNAGPGSENGVGLCLNNLGNTWLYKDRPDLAQQYYEEALNVRTRLFGGVHPDVAETRYNMAQNYRLSGKPDEAIEAFKQCLLALGFDSADEKRLNKVHSYQFLLDAMYYLADVYHSQYLLLRDAHYLRLALTHYEYADEVMDYLRIRYEALGSKLNLVSLGHLLYEAAIAVALELEHITGEARYRHFAFRFSEKSKGLLLLDALQNTRAKAFSGVPGHILTELSNLETSIAELEKERFLNDDRRETGGSPDSLDDRILEKKLLLYEKVRLVSQRYPEYYNLRYGATTLPVTQIQKELLGPDQTLLEYFLGSDLYIFVINRDQFEVVTVLLPEDFYLHLDHFMTSIQEFRTIASASLDVNIRNYVQSATELYRYLVAPVKHYLRKNLIIVPDDRLGYVPYDALLTRQVDSTEYFRNHPYLIRDHSISYNYSASLLADMKTDKGFARGSGYLGFAPDFSNTQIDGLAELLFNSEEILGAKAELGGRVFLKEEATKSNFMAWQSRFGILHLATHGKVDTESEDFSFLAFSKNQSTNPDDYFLYLREIYNLPVHARMVILSACETGTGKLFEGEGIASIARGFSYAGAESLIATRWNINDKTTSLLMGMFLGNINAGMTKDDALQTAILSYIDTQNHHYAHPFYWSSFMAIGNMATVPLPDSPAYQLMLYGSPLILLFAALLFYLRRKVS